MPWCSAQLRGRRPEGVAKLGTVDQQIQDDAGKPKVQDTVINQQKADMKTEDGSFAVPAAYKYGIVWHSTEVIGGSGVPYEKSGDGELIPVRTKYCVVRMHLIVCATTHNPYRQLTTPTYARNTQQRTPPPDTAMLYLPPTHATDVCVNVNTEG